MRPKLITEEQEKKLISLYIKGLPIKQIMADTGIKSEQTIYRLLRENNVDKRPKKTKKQKITFIATFEVLELLSEFQNPSEIINKAILAYAKKA
ncbi:hypothetical protein [uncultured Bacteroides sp.]|jgi:hypothetical protein|uniref:hypothetical protein n=1 Tax=uncultured Bacteroides sp. TaxID=162156 RepID=UPI002053163C|nr:hypothetical protein [uncultured Bacteroides sp.]DAI68442.1 MAG TPA: putative terminase small subunit [Caudoviricetes sp.]